jgi:hypothetical protein
MLFVEHDEDEDGFGFGWRFWEFGEEFSTDLEDANELIQWWGPIVPPWGQGNE